MQVGVSGQLSDLSLADSLSFFDLEGFLEMDLAADLAPVLLGLLLLFLFLESDSEPDLSFLLDLGVLSKVLL